MSTTHEVLEPLRTTLDLARWAPSGDNVQSWRFEPLGSHSALVHGFDTRDHCVYDLDGCASLLALGCLLETLTVAASAAGCRAHIEPVPACPPTHPSFKLELREDASLRPSEHLDAVTRRSVQRRPMSRRPLGESVKASLQAAVGPEFELLFMERFAERLSMARLLFRSAHIRLTTPECYATHARIIDWDSQFSTARIPDAAIGLDAVTVRLMRWAMQSWGRIDFMNRWLGATLAPRLQLDFLPALLCGAHFFLLSVRPGQEAEDRLAAGAAWQRLWLEATRLGLVSQPEMTPLIFARYHREGRRFSAVPQSLATAGAINAKLATILGEERLARALVLGRLGFGPIPTARSLRLPLAELLVSDVREVPGYPHQCG